MKAHEFAERLRVVRFGLDTVERLRARGELGLARSYLTETRAELAQAEAALRRETRRPRKGGRR